MDAATPHLLTEFGLTAGKPDVAGFISSNKSFKLS